MAKTGGAFRVVLKAINHGGIPPRLQKAAWRWWYQLLTWRWRDTGWGFMNYGYLPPDGDAPLELDGPDEPDRCFIGLYRHVVGDFPLAGKRVLEVGSGRGGGASYVARYHHPAAMVGLDFSAQAVALARRLYPQVPNLSFIEGDAENLPFEDASFDVVINVESSHCYGDMTAFVSEVARVLKPGGHFGWADIRGPGMMRQTDLAFDNAPLTPLRDAEITQNVVRALDAMHDRKSHLIGQRRFGRSLLREFTATRGSILYRALKSGDAVYLSKTFRKPPR